MDILVTICGLLCGSLIIRFPQHGARRVIKRIEVRAIESGITIVGMCIVNDQTNRDLEKILES